MNTPPLPPGFVLEQPEQQSGMPPLPPGFELMPAADFSDVSARVDSTADGPGLDIEIVGGTPESQIHPGANDSAFARMISGQPAPQPEGNAVGRALGQIGGRQVLQGAYGLYGALGGDLLDHYVLGPIDRTLGTEGTAFQLGTGGRGYRQAASDLADSQGMYKPQTPEDRVYSDIGEALTGTGLTLGLGAGINALANAGKLPQAATRVGDFLTAQPALQTISAATGAGASGTVRESGGSQGAQLAAGLLGGLGPGIASAGTGAAVRGAVRGRSGAQMQQTIDDFAKLGATPSVGQASGNRVIQGAESLLAGGPTSAGVMGKFAERQADNIGAGLRKMADNMTPNASAERAGRAIERGTELFGRNVGANKRALYWQADQYIPGNTPVGLNNTVQAVTRLTTPMQGAAATTGSLINPRIAALRQNLQQDLAAGNGQITYDALKRIRTDIGEQITDFSLSPETPTRELKQLYAALSRDMEAAAQAQGPQAVAAAKRANNYTRVAADRMEQVQRVIDKNGGPEKVFNAAMEGTKDGGTTLRAVMQSLPKDGQQAVTAAVIKRMGMPTPGQAGLDGAEQFSSSTFLTNWNRLSPEAKRALFDRHGPGFSSDMDRIARVAANIKEGSKVFANPAGTANRAAAQSYAIGLPLSIAQAPFTGHYWPVVATIGGGIAANVAARAMTSPLVVRWLAASTKPSVGSLNASIKALMTEANRRGDDAAIEFANALSEQNPERTPSQSANGEKQ